jgi:hypothetical protein
MVEEGALAANATKWLKLGRMWCRQEQKAVGWRGRRRYLQYGAALRGRRVDDVAHAEHALLPCLRKCRRLPLRTRLITVLTERKMGWDRERAAVAGARRGRTRPPRDAQMKR